jgi:N-acetylmuramoyl-L-alanine amidase
MPSVIAEVAHITNESDRQKLMNEDFRKKAAQALHDGVIKVLYEMEA